MSKKHLIKIGFTLITLSFCIGAILYTSIYFEKKQSLSSGSKDVSLLNNKPQIKRYYVLVAKLDSNYDNLSKNDVLKLIDDKKVMIFEKDKETLNKFFNKEMQETVTSSDKFEFSDDNIGIIRVEDLNPNYKILNFDNKTLFKDNDYSLFVKTNKDSNENEFDKSKVIKMTSVGDIILGRTVYVKMLKNGWGSPFLNVSGKLKDADITFGDLETPLSDSATPPTLGMSFLAPQKAIAGLVLSGIDIVGLANNHSTNFGAKAFTDTLNILKEKGIEFVGGGMNEKEAKKYKTLTVKNKKFAFIDANSIIGDIEAGENSPGDWHINLPPWGEVNQTQVNEVLAKIKEAKKNSDFTIIMFHWSKEYTHDPSEEMKTLGHQFIDAGADMVVGTHPHWTQGVEVYKGKFIAYSLGNFVFDQEWSLETKQGLILDSYFYNNQLINVNLTPILIEDYNRPRILSKDEGKEQMKAVWDSSEKIKSSQ